MVGKRIVLVLLSVFASTLALVVPIGPTRASAVSPSIARVDPDGASGFLEGASHNAYTAQQLASPVTRLWSRGLPGPVSYAVIDDGRAFATVHGWLFALSMATGSTLWAIDIGDTTLTNWSTATIAATAGVVLVSDRPDGGITAYDETNGVRVWQLPGASARHAYSAFVAPGNGLFYADEQYSDAVEAHRVNDGALVWTAQSANEDLAATPTTVFAASLDCGGDEALNALSGAQLWQTTGTCRADKLADAQSVVADGELYDSHGVVDDATTGKASGTFAGYVPPIRVGTTLITQQSGVLVATNLATSQRIWAFSGDVSASHAVGDVTGRALVVGSTVFAVTTTNKLYQLSLTSGQALTPALSLPGTYAGANPTTRAAMSFGDGELLVPTGNYLTAFVSDGTYTGPVAAATARTAVTVPAASAGTVAADYGQDAAHDNANGSGALSGPVTAAWRKSLPGVMSYPLIARGLVYVTDVNDSVDVLDAFSATTGALRWQVRLPGPRNFGDIAMPVYDDGEVFVAIDTGQLYEVDAASGHVRYAHTLAAKGVPISESWAAPVAYDGTLYLSGNASSVGLSLAVRETDATVLWADAVVGAAIGSPAVTSDSVYYAGCAALRLARTTGKVIWASGSGCLGYDGVAPTGVHAGLVWDINNSPAPYTVRETTGKPQYPFTTTVEPALVGSVALVTSDQTLYAEDITTHRLLWYHARNFTDVPVAAGRTVYDVTAHGQVFGMDIATGAITYESGAYYATTHEPNGRSGAPALADNVLIVPEGQHLVAFRGA